MRNALAIVLTGLLLGGCALRYQEGTLDYSAATGAVLEVAGADIHYEEHGPADGDAVVLIHGFGSSLHTWDLLLPALVEDHRVVRLDLKGFGRSSKYDGDYSPSVQAGVVLALMDHLGIERAHLVAHSMGSLVALVVALEAPDRVDRMVLTGAWVYEEQVPWSLRSARTPGMGETIFGLWYAENLQWRFGLSFHEPDRWISEEMLVRARQTLSQPGARAAALATVRCLDLVRWESEYGRVQAPVLLVFGRDDRVARPEYGEQLAAQLPHAELDVVPRCGHFPMLEASAHYARAVRRWLAGGAP